MLQGFRSGLSLPLGASTDRRGYVYRSGGTAQELVIQTETNVKEEHKRRYDALYVASEQAWRDWDHKSKAEWKLAFSIWAALLASATAVAKAEIVLPWQAVGCVGLGIVALHFVFLFFIQGRLTAYRDKIMMIQNGMYGLLGVQVEGDESKENRNWLVRFAGRVFNPSLLTQLGITTLLALSLTILSHRVVDVNAPVDAGSSPVETRSVTPEQENQKAVSQ